MAKILVTGAAGQVGSRLVRQLLARDYEVKGLILPNDPMANRIEGLDIEVVEGNLLDAQVAASVVEGIDAIINTANLVRPLPGMGASEFFDNNVKGTFNLLQAAAKKADVLERLVHVSSSAVYPQSSAFRAHAYDPIDEQHPKRFQGVYGLTKAINEDTVNAHARESGLRTAMIRPAGVVSGEAILSRFNVGGVIDALKGGQRFPEGTLYLADGSQPWVELAAAAESRDQGCSVTDNEGRPWLARVIDARDVAQGCICALESGAALGEAFNVSCPRTIAQPEAARVIGELAGTSVFECQVPVRMLADLDCSKAKAMIGFDPQYGMREMVESALAVQRGESDGYS